MSETKIGKNIIGNIRELKNILDMYMDECSVTPMTIYYVAPQDNGYASLRFELEK